MSSGSKDVVHNCPRTNTNFSGTTSGVTVLTDTTSWNFASPRIKPKGLPPTPGTLMTFRHNTAGGRRVLGSGLSQNIRTGPPAYLLATNFVQTIVNNDSLSDANASVNQALARFSTGDVNLGNFLGELKSSFAMIVKRLGSITGMAQSLKKADFRDIEKSKSFNNYPGSKQDWDRYKGRIKNLPVKNRIANGWLELQFGWLPLLSDVYNAADAIRESYRGKGSVVTSRSTKFKLRNGLKAQSGVWGQVSNPGLRSLAELGLLNPLAVAWELTPFSFVADYFVKIGELLQGSTYNVGMTNVFVWKLHEEQTLIFKSGTSGTYSYPSTLLSDRKYVFRNVSPVISPPTVPRLVLPNFNSSQVSTSIALLVQLLSKK